MGEHDGEGRSRKTPLDVYPELSDGYGKVAYQGHRHVEVYERVLAAIGDDARDILYSDIVALAALTRSTNMLHGFLILIDQWNYQAALSLLRSHLDDLVVVGYMQSVPDRERFCCAIAQAARIQDLTDQLDPKGGKLSWKKLRRHAITRNQELAPWIDRIYELASDFTHFSRSSCAAGLKWMDMEGELLKFSFGTPQYREDGWNPSREEIEGWLGSVGYTTMVMLDWLDEYVLHRNLKPSQQ